MDHNSIKWTAEMQSNGAVTVTLDEAAVKYAKVGENKNLRFKFRENEIVHFPPQEACVLIPKKFNGQDVLYIPAFSESRGRIVHIPLAMFRRIPLEKDQDTFFEPSVRGFNVMLAELDYDIQRARALCDAGTIKCLEVIHAHGAWLEQDADGKWHRVEDKERPMDLFDLRPVANQQ